MPDLFDNFFSKFSTTLNGGRSKPHYGGSSQVNTGKFYSYHENSTNNKYWLPPVKKDDDKMPETMNKQRMGSVASTMSADSETSMD